MREVNQLLVGPMVEALWCYSCDAKTVHEVRFMNELNFVGKLFVCTMCVETIRESRIGRTEVVG